MQGSAPTFLCWFGCRHMIVMGVSNSSHKPMLPIPVPLILKASARTSRPSAWSLFLDIVPVFLVITAMCLLRRLILLHILVFLRVITMGYHYHVPPPPSYCSYSTVFSSREDAYCDLLLSSFIVLIVGIAIINLRGLRLLNETEFALSFVTILRVYRVCFERFLWAC